MQRQVGRRETQFAPQPLSELHAAADAVRPAEQPRRDREIAGFERGANQRAADAHAFDLEGRHFLDREAEPSSRGAQAGGGTFAAPRIVKVVSDHHVPHAEPRGEQVLLEAARADRRELRVEVQAHHAIDIVSGERLQLLSQPRKPRRAPRRLRNTRAVWARR